MMQGFARSLTSKAYMADASAIGRKRVFPTTAGWARIMVASGKAIAQARSSFVNCAVVRPACREVSVRVLRASKPKVEMLGVGFRSTGAREAPHIMGLLHASRVAVERPVR